MTDSPLLCIYQGYFNIEKQQKQETLQKGTKVTKK
jgi:hypothetical protein